MGPLSPGVGRSRGPPHLPHPRWSPYAWEEGFSKTIPPKDDEKNIGGDGGPNPDGGGVTPPGCGCQSNHGAPISALFLLGFFLLLAHRRRTHNPL